MRPAPSAARAADRPRTPAPRIRDLRRRNAGHSAIRTPLPPNAFRRRQAPDGEGEGPPAISDMLVSTGARPLVVLDGLQAHDGDLALEERPEVLGTGGRQGPERDQQTCSGCSSLRTPQASGAATPAAGAAGRVRASMRLKAIVAPADW